MEAVNAAQCQENLLSIHDRVVRDNGRCVMTTKSGNAVIVSEEAWNGHDQ